MNIVCSIDDKYCQHYAALFASMVEFNHDIDKVIIIHDALSEKNINKISTYHARHGVPVIFRRVDASLFAGPMFDDLLKMHFSKAVFYRIMLCDLLEKGIEKVLYLDSDIIVNSSLKELWEEDISDYVVAAVVNPGYENYSSLGLDSDTQYFNSGVLLINLKKWSEHHIKENSIEFIKNNSASIIWPDQCTLNAVCKGMVKYLSPKWNFQTKMLVRSPSEMHMSIDDYNDLIHHPKIIHFSSPSKPWHFFNKHPYKSYYWKYLFRTPWRFSLPEFFLMKSIKKHTPERLKALIKSFL